MASIFDRITGFLRPKTVYRKQSPMVMYHNVAAYNPSKYSYDKLAKEGYQENAVVYRCINEIAQGASTVPFKVFDGDVELDQHPLLNLLYRPNPQLAGNEYFQSLYSYLLLDGNSYAYKTVVGQQVTELHILRPDRMRIVPSATMIPSEYQYVIQGKVHQSFDVDPETGQSDIKHFKLWNPLDDYYGQSPISAAAVDIDQHNLAARHNVNLLNNGARPSGAIVFKPTDDGGLPVQLSEMQRQQLITDLDARFSGSDNAGRAMLLEGDFDWKEMGLSPKDMDFLQLKNMSARDIALCFGVPSQLVGVPDNQTYSNVQEARLALYEETIIPLMGRVESDLNEWLAPMYGENIYIKYDIDSIPAMSERRRRIYDNVVAAVNAGIISRNEARERLGLDQIDGGDDVYIQANLFPLGSTNEPAAVTETPQEAAKSAYGLDEKQEDDPRRGEGEDVYESRGEAARRAGELGCEGTHTLKNPDGETYYMPCSSHSIYMRVSGNSKEDKAESDIDTTPTEAMARNAARGLRLREEYNRGGTRVGAVRAQQLVSRERLSPSVVRRMHSFFSRHAAYKPNHEEDSASYISWLLWGGDEGQTWARRKVEQLDKERDKSEELDGFCCKHCETEEKAEVSDKVKEALTRKVTEHNDEHGDKKGKKVTLRMLVAVFKRGVGAYRTNPESVRPSVTGSDQWAYARVNAFLYAVRTGRFRSGEFDRDLLPEGHPKRTEK